jgi:Tfp pilus assembly protein PilO
MVEAARSWFRENQTLVLFLAAQVVAIGAAATALIAYSVKLETRVHIMETRGAEYTVDRMNKFDQRITILEGNIRDNKERIDRVVEIMLRELPVKKEQLK